MGGTVCQAGYTSIGWKACWQVPSFAEPSRQSYRNIDMSRTEGWTGKGTCCHPEDLSLIPGIDMLETENRFLQVVLWLPHVHCNTYVFPHTHILNKQKCSLRIFEYYAVDSLSTSVIGTREKDSVTDSHAASMKLTSQELYNNSNNNHNLSSHRCSRIEILSNQKWAEHGEIAQR